MVASSEEDARVWPSRAQATEKICLLCPLRLSKQWPSATLQILISLSWEQVASILASGEKATEKTGPLCPRSVSKHSPLSAHHTFAVRSVDAVAISWPSREKFSHITWSSWPAKCCTRSPVSMLHKAAVVSVEAVAKTSPVCHTSCKQHPSQRLASSKVMLPLSMQHPASSRKRRTWPNCRVSFCRSTATVSHGSAVTLQMRWPSTAEQT
mmetsp:Transcript_50537/g.120510  ORF Transcript_50537/g.120510 Transcript_50537/m.120510 type:complete len:210 (+) Transcript_50537:528-1157(+)